MNVNVDCAEGFHLWCGTCQNRCHDCGQAQGTVTER